MSTHAATMRGAASFDGLVAHLDEHYGVRGPSKRKVPFREVFDAAKTTHLENLPGSLWPVWDALGRYCDVSTWQRLIQDHSNDEGVCPSAVRRARNRNLKNDATVAAVANEPGKAGKKRCADEPTMPREAKVPKPETTAVVAKNILTEMHAKVDELRRGQVAIARHITAERVATAKAIESVSLP
ncbi:hypothetical protein SPRG_21608 [Saprolegnia parasitica CBS 223.65]|uniref:Uncharacterized protein n=1 Tax=Saprolegnia parasitica (strain CBS 223.65) TaxID=695850 RepID=A0A067BQM1_SAPPC|nr:hypothetical protein SPRG_21608 [Saprolegnia parasitica CBS 223.65]KDO19075.1 hypothetical protein SPRG_21608 [Saprolegnia parasitica CBS 223.65]|eukprot:XP_012210231.1 hypothetical protein SPRG_21608 [Saprolegnia parasitica CBS 223.65]